MKELGDEDAWAYALSSLCSQIVQRTPFWLSSVHRAEHTCDISFLEFLDIAELQASTNYAHPHKTQRGHP